MLYPSIQQITKGKINRYTLVIATAKSARHVTEKANEDVAQGELKFDKIYNGSYNIIPSEINE